ncbi:protein of unknown function [Vibrio tapetis subsp. tapetis]|uniref:Uncharacterized protein n=1 Tax=Vibrio tapetis subsp. tapetis TaxID=1671868 RepID=A0A2N8Z9T6_9VIBR|nr:protein of unknown function [Vibrio tapetis subsp. tapetis]
MFGNSEIDIKEYGNATGFEHQLPWMLYQERMSKKEYDGSQY